MKSFQSRSDSRVSNVRSSVRSFVMPFQLYHQSDFLINQLSHQPTLFIFRVNQESTKSQTLLCGYLKRSVLHPPPPPNQEATVEIALSVSLLVSPFVTPFHQESSRSTLLINQLYSSIDFNHHSSFQLQLTFFATFKTFSLVFIQKSIKLV